MKIGIGVTTYKRPEHLEVWRQQIDILRPPDSVIYTAYDAPERKGIAYRKNECLRTLKDCDYIFLFDDDCFPIKNGWAEFFIESSKITKQQHYLYLKETQTIKKIKWDYDYSILGEYNNCSGCFMFLTKEAIEKVGAYNPAYGYYGFEHAGYSNRIHAAGLTPRGKYTCPAGAGDYIYAMDFDYHLPFNKQVKHDPSLKDELHLLESYLKKNKEIYDNDTKIYQPL